MHCAMYINWELNEGTIVNPSMVHLVRLLSNKMGMKRTKVPNCIFELLWY